MRVVVFGDVHWMSRHVQEEVYEYERPLDYGPFIRLCKQLLQAPPDVVVDLGDLAERYWEDPSPLPEEYRRLVSEPRFVKLRGNHDRDDGDEYAVFDGVRYEHGHKLGPKPRTESREEYVVDLRVMTKGQRLVHAHTHVPQDAAGLEDTPLDVGSVTFSGTYGEVVDGRPYLRYI